jgi:hypothetical protein
MRIKSKNIIYFYPNFIHNKKKSLKLLTFNCQRIPFYFRPNVNIKKLLCKYDMICLQENFCSIFGSNKKIIKNKNCIIPSGSIIKIIDSGLSIYSNFSFQYIDFIRFHNLQNVDKLSDKGFLIIKIKDIFVINTHLQSSYDSIKNDNAQEQLNQIFDYMNNFNKVIICGDFNMNLFDIKLPVNYNITFLHKPTHWQEINNSIFNKTSATQKNNMIPCYFDGFIYKNVSCNENLTEINKIDKYSDHLSTSSDFFL